MRLISPMHGSCSKISLTFSLVTAAARATGRLLYSSVSGIVLTREKASWLVRWFCKVRFLLGEADALLRALPPPPLTLDRGEDEARARRRDEEGAEGEQGGEE